MEKFDAFLIYSESAIYFGIIPILMCTITLTFIYLIFLYFKNGFFDEIFSNDLAVVASFASVGGAVGLFMGASREPAVGAVVPAVLTFIAGLSAFIFVKDHTSTKSGTISVAIIFLVISTVFCGSFGATMRGAKEQYEKDYAVYMIEKKRETENLPATP